MPKDKKIPEPKLLLWALLALLAVYHGYRLSGGKSSHAPNAYAELGYVIRYAAGQTPGIAVRGLPSPTLNLFHANEMDYQFPRSTEPIALSLVSSVKPVVDHLTRSGVETVLLFVPTKTSLYRNELPVSLPESSLWTRGERGCAAEPAAETGQGKLREFLRAAFPENAVDPSFAYQSYRYANPGARLYAPLDYHWSATGIALAAVEVVNHLRRKGWKISEPHLEEAGRRPVGTSYLMAQFLLPDWFTRSRPEFQSEEALFHLDARNEDSRPARTIIAGSSFDASSEEFTLADELSRVLGRKTINFARTGGGFRGSIDEMHRSAFGFHAGDLLVWEMPLCCLGLAENPTQLPLPDVSAPRAISTSGPPAK